MFLTTKNDKIYATIIFTLAAVALAFLFIEVVITISDFKTRYDSERKYTDKVYGLHSSIASSYTSFIFLRPNSKISLHC